MQQKDTADPKTAEEIRAITREFDEVFNKHDATAVAALYTEDSVQAAPEGVYYGRQAIQKRFADDFQQSHLTNHIGKAYQVNALGNNIWKVGNGVVPSKDRTVLCQLKAILRRYMFVRAVLGMNACRAIT